MAGPTRDGKDALIYYGAPRAKFDIKQLARYAAVGDSATPNKKTSQAFGWSSKLKSNELLFMLDREAQPKQSQSDYLFKLENFNLGVYATTSDQYPSNAEIKTKRESKGGTPLIVIASDAERNSIILPSRQSESKWIGRYKSGANNTDSTVITRDIDDARKLTVTGFGSDIVIAGQGNDFIGPGLPAETWRALSKTVTDGTDWATSITDNSLGKAKLKLDLGTAKLEIPTQSNSTPGQQGSSTIDFSSARTTPINGENKKSGKKAYIGGSGNDTIWGGNDNDYLVGDRYDSFETYFPRSQASRNALYATVGYSNTTNSALSGLQDRLTPASYNGGSRAKSQGYDFWFEKVQGVGYFSNEAFMNGPIDDKYQFTRTGSIIPEPFNNNTWGRSPQYDGSHTAMEPVWKPGGDVIFGGAGNDIIFGDNNTNAIFRLLELKKSYNEPNEKFYYEGTLGKGKLGTFEEWIRLGNDYLNGGDGSDAIYGGFGVDHIVGGKGNDLIFLPDIITAPGYINLRGPSGNASWIVGGELSRLTKLTTDQSGTNTAAAGEADVFVLGLHYSSEAAMSATKTDDGGDSGYEAEVDNLNNLASNKWREFANTVSWGVGQDLASNIPILGGVISPFLGILDAMFEKENDPSGKGKKYEAPPSASDATVAISDFSPTNILVIPVPKGASCETKQFFDGGGSNLNEPEYDGFSQKRQDAKGNITTNKQGTMIRLSDGNNIYNRVWLPGLTYNNKDKDPAYQFYRLDAKTSLQGYGLTDSTLPQFGDNVDIWVYASKAFSQKFSTDSGLIGGGKI